MMQALFKRKLFFLFGILIIFCSNTLAGDVALVRMHTFFEGHTSLLCELQRDGHRTFGLVDTFVDPTRFDVCWLIPEDCDLTDINIAKLYTFVCSGGHLILVLDRFPYLVEATNRIFEFEPWFDELGRPQAYDERVLDAVPDTFISYFGPIMSSFILNFDLRWERGSGIDTLITAVGCAVGCEAEGCLTAVGWGASDCYGAVYDSFAVQILAGNYYAGEITVIADMDLFADEPFSPYPINLFDNLQFARQLFACNTRADSAGLEQADSTLRLRLYGDFTNFDDDSSEWKFRILHVWPPYQFRGHELGARFIAPNILEIDYPPIYNPVYDTVEVCLMFLPDSNGETVLWDFPVCDTFKFDFTGIAETPTPQAFAISAYPNPFNSAVSFTIDGAGVCNTPLRIEIYDVAGRKIAQLPDGVTVGEGLRPSRSSIMAQTGGSETTPLRDAEFIWQPAATLGSGVYLIRIEQNGQIYTRPVVYVK